MPARLAIIADESGNPGEKLQVLAGISGPTRRLLELERKLRMELKRHGLEELKWAGLRKRRNRYDAARAFFSCFAVAAGEGVAADLLLGRLKRDEPWILLYRGLVAKVRRRRRGRLSLYPDQRTGMPWKRLRRAATLRTVREARSGSLALVQLADLMAGILRFSLLPEGGMNEARRLRLELLNDFESLRTALPAALKVWKATTTTQGARRVQAQGRN